MPDIDLTTIIIALLAVIAGWFALKKQQLDDNARMRTDMFEAMDRLERELTGMKQELVDVRAERDTLRERVDELECQVRNLKEAKHQVGSDLQKITVELELSKHHIGKLERESNEMHKKLGLPLKYPPDPTP